MDSSYVICWASPFVILGGVRSVLSLFILFLMENPVGQQCRPRSDATSGGICSGSALFVYDPFKDFQLRKD